MKKYLPLIILTSLLQFSCADSQTAQNQADFGRNTVFPTPVKNYPNLEIYLNEYSSAQNRRDLEKIFSLSFPPEIAAQGGRESFLENLRSFFKDKKDYAFLAGKPTQIVAENTRLLAVIPCVTKHQSAQGKQLSREILIAISEDNGGKWSFANATQVEKRKMLFPDSAGKFEIPEIRPPTIEEKQDSSEK